MYHAGPARAADREPSADRHGAAQRLCYSPGVTLPDRPPTSPAAADGSRAPLAESGASVGPPAPPPSVTANAPDPAAEATRLVAAAPATSPETSSDLAAPDVPVDVTTRVADRVASLIEVALCSGFPTQLMVMIGLALAGLQPFLGAGELSLRYVTLLSLSDTVLLVGLILLFTRMRGERAGALFLGGRPVVREALVGVAWAPAVLLVVGALGLVINQVAPWLRNVPENPLAALLRNPRDAAIFAIVVVVAGGLREEIQRAFILDRFERHLGGAMVGLVLFSVAFGLGHALQGWDAVLLTGSLGVIWGAMFLARRSVVAPMVCHAVFNLSQVVYHAYRG